MAGWGGAGGGAGSGRFVCFWCGGDVACTSSGLVKPPRVPPPSLCSREESVCASVCFDGLLARPSTDRFKQETSSDSWQLNSDLRQSGFLAPLKRLHPIIRFNMHLGVLFIRFSEVHVNADHPLMAVLPVDG